MDLIADCHADPLIWSRDLLEPNQTRGHVDIPRLLAGNVGLQGFGIVTKLPRGANIDKNDNDTDIVTLLVFAQVFI